jgi:hypothetical protein
MSVKYENGSIHSPVIELGEDPTDTNNVLVSRLATAVSVPKWTVTEEEGTPTEPESVPAGTTAEKDQAIADLSAAHDEKDGVIEQLKAKLAELEGNHTPEDNQEDS